MKDDLPNGATLTVEVCAPRSIEPKEFTWAKNMLVSEAADQAAQAFGYEDGTPTFQNVEDEVLDRSKNLVSQGIRDGDKLEIVDSGGCV